MLSNFFNPSNSNNLSLTEVITKYAATIDNMFKLESNPRVSIIIKLVLFTKVDQCF